MRSTIDRSSSLTLHGQEYNQAQQDKKAGQLMIQSTKAIYGGSSSYNKADPEVQLAIAQANS